MVAAVLLLAALSGGPVTTTRPADLRPGLAAFPRIARPATAAARGINAAVARRDARALQAARECRAESVERSSWTRTIDTTMHGPDFVSYLVTDEIYCGGAHPTSGHAAIVYDLATGAPVDWPRLLSRRLAGTPAPTSGADGAQVATLSSPRLRALYAAGYAAAARAQESPAECLAAAREEGFVEPMFAWLDARAGALVLQFDLEYVIQACSAAVAIPAAVLQREGASSRLVRALRATRRGASR